MRTDEDLREAKTAEARARQAVVKMAAEIRPILGDVQIDGAAAVLRWTEQLDGVRPPQLRVPVERLRAAEGHSSRPSARRSSRPSPAPARCTWTSAGPKPRSSRCGIR